jgi:hypothetical protein
MASNADQTGIGYPASQIDANKTQYQEYLAALKSRGLSLQTSMLGAPISAPQSIIREPLASLRNVCRKSPLRLQAPATN